MAKIKQETKNLIILGVIILFILSIGGKLDLNFLGSVSTPNCDYISSITNDDFPVNTLEDWISVDRNGDGALEGYYPQGMVTWSDSQCTNNNVMCADNGRTAPCIITRTPTANYKVIIKSGTSSNEVYLCDIANNRLVKFKTGLTSDVNPELTCAAPPPPTGSCPDSCVAGECVAFVCSYPSVVDCNTQAEVDLIEEEWYQNICNNMDLANCVSAFSDRACGNSICEAWESESSCPEDCVVTQTCTDSDTDTIYEFGTVTYNSQTFPDSCSGDTLTEYTCLSSTQMSSGTFFCPNWGLECIGGKCTEGASPDCIDNPVNEGDLLQTC